MNFKLLSLILCSTIIVGVILGCQSTINESHIPRVSSLITQIDEDQLLATVIKLQEFNTRIYNTEGNMDAGNYLFQRLSERDGLEVSFLNGKIRNIIANYPGTDPNSTKVYMVGAHYDSASDSKYAPGASDNAIGVAVVLEYVRILTQQKFKHDITFALWNAEEVQYYGSTRYAQKAKLSKENIDLYINYDSTGYDPQKRLRLKILYNEKSEWAAEKYQENNDLYNIGFKKIYMEINHGGSDHESFWSRGYSAVSTHSESHGPTHSADDTVDIVSTAYAKKNAQLGMSLLVELAEIN